MNRVILLFLLVFLASCANNADESTPPSFSSTGESREGENLERRFKTNATSGFKQDTEGKWITDSSKRSSLESKGSNNMAGKKFSNNEFKKAKANLPAHWSRTEYAKPQYAGNTDGSSLRKSSADATKSAREGSIFSFFREKKIASQQIQRTTANEASHNSLRRINDTNARVRTNKIPEPVIIDVQQQREMEIQQTKSFMGR